MKRYERITLFVVFIILIGSSLAGCGIGNPPAGRIPGPDWSRGFPVGTNIGGTIGMFAQESTGLTHFVWPTADDDLAHIHYRQLDQVGDVTADFNFNLPAGRQRTPRLLQADDENLHLFWANRVSGSRGWALWHAILNETGNVIKKPAQISPDDLRVGDYIVKGDDSGNALVIWEQDSSQGLWALNISADGIATAPVKLTESGDSPGAFLDQAGTLYLSWRDDLQVKYATIENGELGLTSGQTIANLQNIIANVDGPVVGLAGDWVYIFWSVFARSGLESGSGWTEYVAFPKGEQTSMPATRVWTLTEEVQPYIDYDGAYNLSQLAPAVTSPALSADYIVEPNTANGKGNELAVAVAASQTSRLDEIIQMAVLVFKDGEFDGYQMAGKTNNFSQEGVLQSDNDGNLYLAWREGTGSQLYFATTEPNLRSEINKLGQTDILQAMVDGGFEAVTGALFFPLSLIWFVPGGVLLGIWRLRRDDETVEEAASRIFLVLSILLYEGTKFLFFPSIMSYIPFSAWLDIPVGLGSVLQFVVPLTSLALGILFAEWIRRRRSETPTVLYFFSVGGMDALITLMIYGVNFLGVL